MAETWTEAEFIRFELADELKRYFDDWTADALEGIESPEALSMLLDIGSLWRVNWDEIAKALAD